MSEEDLLLEVQRRFSAGVRSSADQQAALPMLDGDAGRNEELLAVYRGNSVANVRKALSLAYPVIERIVGEEFFSGLCRAFWEQSPSSSGDLNEYGEGFSDFLAAFPHVADLPYLSDVAHAEWFVCRALHAADHVPATLMQLAVQFADASPETVGVLRLDLQPGLMLWQSQWPVASIWQQHQPEYTEEINIDLDNAECMAVHRVGFRVQVTTLSPAEFALWRQAKAGQALSAMLDAAFAIDESFDVQAALQAGLTREFVTSVHA
jgi:hypothetical protein